MSIQKVTVRNLFELAKGRELEEEKKGQKAIDYKITPE